MTSASAHADDQPRARHALAGAVAGMLAAAVAIGAAQLAAGLTVPQGSPVIAVGQAAIDLTPPPVKDFAISAFGTADKTVLLGGILVVLALYAALVGILAVRRLAIGMWGLALFAFIGLVAALTRPDSTAEYVVPTLAGAAAGAFALTRLARAAGRLSAPRARPGGPPRRRRIPGRRRTARAVPPAPGTLTPPDLPAPRRGEPARLTADDLPLGLLLYLPSQPGRSGAAARARAAAVPGQQRDSRGRGGGRDGGRAGTGHQARRHPGAGRIALPPAGGGRAAASGRQRPAHSRPELVHHPERQLLPGRHRLAAAPGGPVDLAAADPRDGAAGGHHHLRRTAQAPAHRGLRDAHLRVRPGGRPLRGQREVARRQPGRPDQAGPPAGGREPAAVHLGRRVHLGHSAAGRAGRTGRAARRRDERHGAARGARLPGADGDPRPVRLRVRDQVGHRHRGHHVRGRLGLLGRPRLVAAGADQERSPGSTCPRSARPSARG